MTPEILSYVRQTRDKYGLKGKILDVGSFDVNGCMRPIFIDEMEGNEYTGLDMQKGPNVDIVANSHKIPFENNTFDVALSADLLEHDDMPFMTCSEIYRVLKTRGYFILTACSIACGNVMEDGGRHGYPYDYWRFTKESFEVLLKPFSKVVAEEAHNHVYAWAIK